MMLVQFVAMWLEGNPQACQQSLMDLLSAIRMTHQQMMHQVYSPWHMSASAIMVCTCVCHVLRRQM